MIHPFVACPLQLKLGAEGAAVRFTLGTLVDHAALQPRERDLVGVRIHQVLLDLRSNRLDEVAEVSEDGVVAQHRVATLQDIMYAHARE
jgi:hypothetical protein